MVVFPLDTVVALPNPVALQGRRPCLIFDLTWSGLNESTNRLAPMEAMLFGIALRRILHQVLAANPCLGPVYMRKVELADT